MIKLSILGIEFESDKHRYRDDGFVKDIHEHSAKIYQEFGDNPETYYIKLLLREEEMPLVSGNTMSRDNSDPIEIISFYQHFDSHLKEVFVRGHEETHALKKMCKLDLLQEKITCFGLDVEMLPGSDVELIADIGGLYAVILHGFDTLSITSFLSNRGENGKIILGIYRKFLESENAQLKNNTQRAY